MKIGKSIIENGIYGFAVGDALGVPYEFMSRERMTRYPCVAMTGHGTHDQPTGTWSDDTSLTLATLDGLTEMSEEDGYDTVMSKFDLWLNEGEYSIDGVFDVGRTTMQAVLKYKRGIPAVDCGGRAIGDNGNGALMRIFPAVIYSLFRHGNIDYEFIDNVGALTHGHAISKTACRIYADIVQSILQNVEKEKLLSKVDIYGQDEFSRLKSADFSLLNESEIKSSGYVVYTLEAALWCFINTNSYKDCVIAAVNLGSDTDTGAAIAGSLAGLYYGKQNIPGEWMELLRGKQLIDALIDKFCNRMGNIE